MGRYDDGNECRGHLFSDMFLASQRRSICAQDSRLVCNLTREDVESVEGVETCMFCLVASVQDFFAVPTRSPKQLEGSKGTSHTPIVAWSSRLHRWAHYRTLCLSLYLLHGAGNLPSNVFAAVCMECNQYQPV